MAKVTAHLPATVKLAKRNAQNTLSIDVNLGKGKEGSLHIFGGGVEWWPAYNEVNAHRAGWSEFIELMTKHVAQHRGQRN